MIACITISSGLVPVIGALFSTFRYHYPLSLSLSLSLFPTLSLSLSLHPLPSLCQSLLLALSISPCAHQREGERAREAHAHTKHAHTSGTATPGTLRTSHGHTRDRVESCRPDPSKKWSDRSGYSMLLCAAVWCGVLSCAAVCCSVLLYFAVCCNVLQCAAVLLCAAIAEPVPTAPCLVGVWSLLR